MVFPAVMDMHAIAELLGVSKQRVQQLVAGSQLPQPVAELRIGRIWLRSDIETWARDRASARKERR